MSFLSAARLWLLLGALALVGVYVAVQGRRRRYAVRFTNLALLGVVAPERPRWRRHVAALFFLVSLMMLIVGFARPTRAEKVPRDRATIVMAIDVSLSMDATDVLPSRLDAAQAAATEFVDILPDRFHVGLVAFGGTAQILLAPTLDHNAVRQAIATLRLREGTGIGEAIFASLDALLQVPSDPGQDPPPAHIVLMSDGETTQGRPNRAGVVAAVEAGVPVSTIAFGTPLGSIVYEGQRIPVPVNGPALRDIADMTDGSYFEAATAEELRRVYEGVGTSIGFVEEQREVTVWFLGGGLLFAMTAAAASLLWFQRLP